jgi:ABC-type Fe3+ transport system permease subunit
MEHPSGASTPQQAISSQAAGRLTHASGTLDRSGPRTLAIQERRFALGLLAPALLVLVLTTTIPLVYLGWNSLQRIDLGMPWMSGFAGIDNYTKMGSDPRFWNSLWLTVIYTASTVALQSDCRSPCWCFRSRKGRACCGLAPSCRSCWRR